MTQPYGKSYTVRGWGDEQFVSVILDEAVPAGYTAVVRPVEGPVILVPTVALTPVDTTPAEPEPGVYFIGKTLCARPEVANVLCRWLNLDDCEWYLWADLWRDVGGHGVTIRRLIPAPEPVELPWKAEGIISEQVVRVLQSGASDCAAWVSTRKRNTGVHLSAEQAEEMAAALLTAARAAREATP